MRQKKRVEINKFNNFDKTSTSVFADRFYNYLPTGILNASSGVKTATFPKNMENLTEKELKLSANNITKVEGLAYFKQYFPKSQTTTHRLLVYADDKKVYINQMLDDMYDVFWLYELTFDTPPITLAFKKDDSDAIILASKSEMKIWKTGFSPYTISDVPVITSMCMNEGVLFCTINEPAFKIWYATDLDAENIGNINKNSGYISLEDDLGYARKVITYDENVYVFRDYGISKITYVKNEIVVSQVYSSNTKIFTNTVSICGNNVLFLTKEGVYTFNGVKVNKVDIYIKDLFVFNNDAAVASSLGNKYYLALRLDFKDENPVLCETTTYVNNALIILDTTNFSFEILRGVDVKSMLPIKTELFEKMLLTFNSAYIDKIGEITDVSACFDLPLPKLWCSGNFLNNANTKLITKLSVVADKDVKFKLKYDNKEITFTTYQEGLNQFIFKVCCKQVKLEISSVEPKAKVEKVILDYYEY